MPDDKNKTDARDSSKVVSDEDSEVQHIATEAGISVAQARELIRAYGNDRAKIMQAAKSLPGSGNHVRSSRV